MVTILDGHPDESMSYELYPHLLDAEKGNKEYLLTLAEKMEHCKNYKNIKEHVESESLGAFITRIPRGGLTTEDFAKLLRAHVEEGMDFGSGEERLQFMERCCLAKMKKEGSSRWGVKCLSTFENYLKIWPTHIS